MSDPKNPDTTDNEDEAMKITDMNGQPDEDGDDEMDDGPDDSEDEIPAPGETQAPLLPGETTAERA